MSTTVHEGRTLVRGWRTGRPRGVDICPYSSYIAAASAGGGHLCASCKHRTWWTFVRQSKTAAAVHLGWTLVYQLETAAVHQGKTNVYELQPLGLHNKFTNLL